MKRLNLSKPYDRAVLECLLMMAGRDRCIKLSKAELTVGHGLGQAQPLSQ